MPPKENAETNPSKIKTVPIDTAELLKRSLTFLIFDQNLYADKAGKNFSPERYAHNRPEVVRVIDLDPDNSLGFNYEMLDGHHRLLAAISYKEIDPKYEILVDDVTDDLIARKYPGQQHLKEEQHLKESVDPEKAHEELAPARTVAHILNKWPRMVGPETAEKYSALTALTYFGASFMGIKTTDQIKIFLTATEHPNKPNSRRIKLFEGETSAERKKIESAILKISEVIRSRKTSYVDVVEDAYPFLKGDKLEPEEVRKQVLSLLNFPGVQKKIGTNRSEIEPLLIAAALDVTGYSDIEALYSLLTKQQFGYDQLVKFLRPAQKSLSERYNIYMDRQYSRLHPRLTEKKSDGEAPTTQGSAGSEEHTLFESGRTAEQGVVYVQVFNQYLNTLSPGFSPQLQDALVKTRSSLETLLNPAPVIEPPDDDYVLDPRWEELKAAIYNPTKDGKQSWFVDNFTVGNPREENVHKVTFMIEDSIQKIFPYFKKNIIQAMQDQTGEVSGVDAIDSLFSERVGRLVRSVGWEKDVPDFDLLVAVLCKRAIINSQIDNRLVPE